MVSASCMGDVMWAVQGRNPTARNAERCDEDIHEANEVEEICGAVLPEGPLAVNNTLLPVFPLLLDKEGVVLLGLAKIRTYRQSM